MPGPLLLRIAKQATEHYVKHGEVLELNWQLPSELMQQRACYVSIFEKPGRHMRAMHGSTLPRHSTLAKEVVANAVDAVRNQPHGVFRQSSLPYLIYSVAVLGPLERITSPAHLNPAHYGLYVKSDRNKSAVILPQRTGIDTPDEQIATAFRESGIDPQREAVTMYRFLVEHFD